MHKQLYTFILLDFFFLRERGCQFCLWLPEVIHLNLDHMRSILLFLYCFLGLVIKAWWSNRKTVIPGPVALQSEDGGRSQFLHCWTGSCWHASSRNGEGPVRANSRRQSADNGPWPNHAGNSSLSCCRLQQKKEAHGLLWLWTVSFTSSAHICEIPVFSAAPGLSRAVSSLQLHWWPASLYPLRCTQKGRPRKLTSRCPRN